MEKKKITISWLCSKYEGNGPPMTPIMLGLDPDRFNTMCIFLKKTSDKPNFIEDHGCKAFYISKKDRFRIINFPVIRKLAQILKDQKVDILYCQRHQTSVYGAIAGRIANTPLVFSQVHGLNRSKTLRRKLINFLALWRISRVITVGNAVKNDFQSCNPWINPDKVISLNNSISYERFANVSESRNQVREQIGLGPDDFVLGTIGRLAPTKGYQYLIAAFANAKRHIPNAKLLIIGSGKLEKQLKETVTEKNISDSVHFLGYRSDVEKLLKAMDVFVLSSIAEGMPGVILEAMACGLPCISTNVGAICEMLENGKYGILVPPADEDAIKEAIISMAKGQLGKFLQQADDMKQKIKEEYDHGVITKRFENICEIDYKAFSAKIDKRVQYAKS